MKAALLLVFLVAATAAAQTENPVAHAAQIVAQIHDQMLDPASFALDGVYITKPVGRWADRDRKGQPTYCYTFRSHNTMGGYSQGAAYENPLDRGKLDFVSLDGDGEALGYNTGWVAPCKSKNIDRDITADVEAVAPALYQKTR